MALFILDFDETITSKNTHNAVSHLTHGKMDDIWTVVKEIGPIGGFRIWQNTIRAILNHDHRLAIASFNAYGPILIPMYLNKVVGLTEEEISRIHIESWLPSDPHSADKNEHINFSIKAINYQGPANTIVLVDDDLKNISAARNKGYRTIHAVDNYLEQINKLSKKLSSSSKSMSFVDSFFKKYHPDRDAPESDTTKPDKKCVIM